MKTVILLAPLLSLQTFAWSQTSLQVKGNYALLNLHTGSFLGMGAAQKIVLDKATTTHWNVQPLDGGGYTLKETASGNTLQPARGRKKAGEALEMKPQDGSDAQQYELIEAEGGQCWIRLKGTDLYLTASGTAVVLQPFQEGDLQRWKLRP
ncbi:RICIN domain-containing protein [Dinghuibacter silviterrae]|uniref:Ricin-type beta-trefoil lectin protein n=1 Tax=Dinghuibacter silviterrae TaxID=1539049 RepID=A0A4R8DWZ8_9BACT|nr:RICIN domain-containing protein [Dinghuibacter silviterrae]TDX02055.1 ricin-type beta-trefoil lectin protein [Dinghuibacter silviterrae]